MLLRDGDRAWWAKLVQRTFSLACESVPTGPLFEDLFDSLYQHYATAQAWEIYPEVVSVLEELRSQFTLHVLSNFDPRLLPVLEGLGIRQNFREVILSSEIGVRKPDSQLFVHALQRTGATPALAMHIGDEWLADIQGAQNAGWRTFHVRRPQVDLRGLREQVSTTPASDHQ